MTSNQSALPTRYDDCPPQRSDDVSIWAPKCLILAFVKFYFKFFQANYFESNPVIPIYKARTHIAFLYVQYYKTWFIKSNFKMIFGFNIVLVVGYCYFDLFQPIKISGVYFITIFLNQILPLSDTFDGNEVFRNSRRRCDHRKLLQQPIPDDWWTWRQPSTASKPGW